MPKIVCKNCKKRYDSDLHMLCPKCGTPNYKSSDAYLDAHRSDMRELVDTHDEYISGTAYEADEYSKKFHKKVAQQSSTSPWRANSRTATKAPTQAISPGVKIILWILRIFIIFQIISVLPTLIITIEDIVNTITTPVPEEITHVEHSMGESMQVLGSDITITSCYRLEYDWLDEITPIGHQVIAIAFHSDREEYEYFSNSSAYVGNKSSDSYYESTYPYDINDKLLEHGISTTSTSSLYSGTYFDYTADPPVPNIEHLIFVVDDSWTSVDFYFEEYTGTDDRAVLSSIHSLALPISTYEEEE